MSSYFRLLLIVLLGAVITSSTFGQTHDQNQNSSQKQGLNGKVMCGYQGWFRCPGDGTNRGWNHYTNQRDFAPGKCGIEIWPDVRELPTRLRVKTPFLHPDGSAGEVYSSVSQEAVDLHFKWMHDYGIDGIFLQRFAVTTVKPKLRAPLDQILLHCQRSAKTHARSWALMYDLSGLKSGQVDAVIADWKHLHTQVKIDTTPSPYLHHRGKPLVALWGMGFKDRKTTLDQWERLITFLKSDPVYGGCSIMIGVPSYWRSLKRDSIADPKLHKLIEMADVISPWMVGRYGSVEGVKKHVEETLKPDMAWCQPRKIDYLPVIFPGFSWQNLMSIRGKKAPFDHIPRQRGQFLWSQARQARMAGAEMLYVAMFDELDEGTAILKTRNDPPVGENRFLAEKGLPSDHYLWLTGKITKLIHDSGESKNNFPETFPKRISKKNAK